VTAARREFPAWPIAALAVPIIARFLVLAIALLVGDWTANPNRIIPAWAQILQSACFASVASVLLTYGRRDRRAWALGLFILDAAGTLLLPFAKQMASQHPLIEIALKTPSDAFQAALIWFFATAFPHPAKRPALATVFYVGTTVAFALGVTLAAIDAYALMADSASSSAFAHLAGLLRRPLTRGDPDWYFSLQWLLLVPLLVAMPFKFRESGPDNRRRFMVLAAGIGIGYLPLVAETVIPTFWPQFAGPDPPYLRLRGAIIVIALTLVPFSAAYAALVQRTLDVSLIVRQALQYLLARSFIWALAIAPFVSLLVIIALNRERSVIELLSGPLGVTLGAVTLAAAAAAFGRRRLLAAVDRRFFRHQADAKALLIGLTDRARQATSLDALQQTLLSAVESVFHPSAMVMAVEGPDDLLHSLTGDQPPLARGSALGLLLSGKNTPVDLSATGAAVLDRLSLADRKWIEASRAIMVLPLLGSTNELVGVLALGEKKSELAYRLEDQQLLAAVAAPVGLALQRVLVAERAPVALATSPETDLRARECHECGTVHDATAAVCSCGGLLQRALVPRLLEDRLRFERRIGAGGMGVVYLAMDLRLGAYRAVKTLPFADPVLIAGMRREAHSMSAARHPNLATLHGLEIWRGVPMLVMEYLEGGTLAFRLKSRPMPVAEALELGARLGEALATLHSRGVLHRDIKPSNIGFTFDGVPKLLDFGLAKLVPRISGPASTTEPEFDGSTRPDPFSSHNGRVHGTPGYLSPEVLRGASPAARDDLWSLGVTVLEACVGRNPFQSSSVAATVSRVLADDRHAETIASTLPEFARTLFRELLGPPAGRPQTAREFVVRLGTVHSTGGDS